ncbi:MAG: RNA-binding protein [Magnetospirillum sp.]|nr:RNA-binding protein [Magnetospirillum sp.]
MPKGPKGQRRPADVVGAAIMVAKIATGEIEEPTELDDGKEYARKGGREGGKARAAVLTQEQRSEIARIAAEARWKKS